MSRQLIFRHYYWIAMVAVIVGGAIIPHLSPRDGMAWIGSLVAGILGFCYFVQRQKLAETQLFKDLFTEFNERYDQLNDDLADIQPCEDPVHHERRVIVDYFNLCAEEYLFYSEGYIHEEAWSSWCRGMLGYLEREPFKSVWQEEVQTSSYYGLTLEVIRRAAV